MDRLPYGDATEDETQDTADYRKQAHHTKKREDESPDTERTRSLSATVGARGGWARQISGLPSDDTGGAIAGGLRLTALPYAHGCTFRDRMTSS